MLIKWLRAGAVSLTLQLWLQKKRPDQFDHSMKLETFLGSLMSFPKKLSDKKNERKFMLCEIFQI